MFQLFLFFLKTANSLKRMMILNYLKELFIPSKRLRGFERGKVGPKDGNDFIGGNYASTINFSSTIPQIFQNSQNIDFLFFFDAANVWGVDYDSSIR